MKLAHGLAVQHGVVGESFFDLNVVQVQPPRDFRDHLVADAAIFVLRVHQHGNQRAAFEGVRGLQLSKRAASCVESSMRLAVDLSQNDIDRSDARHHVRNQLAGHQLRQRLQIDIRRRAEMCARQFWRAVAGDKASQLAARRFHGRKSFARRRRKPFGKNLEVVDERFPSPSSSFRALVARCPALRFEWVRYP